MSQRALIGDAPSWVTRHILLVWVGIPVGVVVYVGVLLAAWKLGMASDSFGGSPRPVVTVVVVAALLNLGRLYLAKRPLDAVDRRYYRMALWAIGLFGLATNWFIGAALGAVLLVHSFFIDRAVEPATGTPPITKEYREWQERRGGQR